MSTHRTMTNHAIQNHPQRMNVTIGGQPGSGKTKLRALLLAHGYECSDETTNDGTVVRFGVVAPHVKETGS